MSPEQLVQGLDVWISQYLAAFCLITITAWAVRQFLWAAHWQQALRDSVVYLVAIGILALILACRPTHADPLYWTPLAWLSFTILIVLEGLWIAFVVDQIGRGLRELINGQPLPTMHPHSRPTPYQRP